MHVSVYDIENTLFDGEADKVIAKTTTGEITVLKDHIPLVTTLVKAPLRIIDAEGKVTLVQIKSGVLEVRPNDKIVVLLDTK